MGRFSDEEVSHATAELLDRVHFDMIQTLYLLKDIDFFRAVEMLKWFTDLDSISPFADEFPELTLGLGWLQTRNALISKHLVRVAEHNTLQMYEPAMLTALRTRGLNQVNHLLKHVK